MLMLSEVTMVRGGLGVSGYRSVRLPWQQGAGVFLAASW